MKKQQVQEEANEIYFAIKKIMAETNLDYCISWWLNSRNFSLKYGLKTPQINQRCQLLIKQGFLVKHNSRMPASYGITYKLTDKQPTTL